MSRMFYGFAITIFFAGVAFEDGRFYIGTAIASISILLLIGIFAKYLNGDK